MTTKAVIDSALALPPAERLDLIGILWDSLSPEDEALELTPELCAELDRRADDMDRNPDDRLSWEEVEARVRDRLR